MTITNILAKPMTMKRDHLCQKQIVFHTIKTVFFSSWTKNSTNQVRNVLLLLLNVANMKTGIWVNRGFDAFVSHPLGI